MVKSLRMPHLYLDRRLGRRLLQFLPGSPGSPDTIAWTRPPGFPHKPATSLQHTYSHLPILHPLPVPLHALQFSNTTSPSFQQTTISSTATAPDHVIGTLLHLQLTITSTCAATPAFTPHPAHTFPRAKKIPLPTSTHSWPSRPPASFAVDSLCFRLSR